MFQVLTAESKERSPATRTVPQFDPQPEPHPQHSGMGRRDYTAARGPRSAGAQLHQDFAGLQRTIGNQAVLRMLGNSRPVIQTKLAINEPGDSFEQEADQVADRIMSATPAPVVQRACSSCKEDEEVQRKCAECEEEDKLKRKPASSGSVSPVPPIVHDVLRSPGEPLDASARSYMESRFQTDFSHVRVHTDTRASESARAVNALAYTVGRNLVFSSGQYRPASSGGMKLLAHELTHVLQQGHGSSQSVPKSPLTIDGSGEAQAEQTAASVMAGRPVTKISSEHSQAVQRQEPIPIPPEVVPPGLPPEFPFELPETDIDPDFTPEEGSPEMGTPDEAPLPDGEGQIPEDGVPETPPEEAPGPAPSETPQPGETPEPGESPAPGETPQPGETPSPDKPLPNPPIPPPTPAPQPGPQPQPQPQPKPSPPDEIREPDCGSPNMPLTRVSFFPGTAGQGGRVKASPLTKCPGNTIGSRPDPRIYAQQFQCIRNAGELGFWVRAHLLHGRTSSSGPFNLHGPGNDIRNLIITDQSLNRNMRIGAEGPAIGLVYGGNRVLWYESTATHQPTPLDFFAQSITVNFGAFNTATGTEGPRIGGGTFNLTRTPPNCPGSASVQPPGATTPPVIPMAPLTGAQPLRSKVVTQSSIRMCLQTLEGQTKFHVADGGVEVRVGARWFDPAGEVPLDVAHCPARTYTITLVRNGWLGPFDISTSKPIPVGTGATIRWRHLHDGDYHLRFDTVNTNPSCCLIGDVLIGTFPAPAPVPGAPTA